MRFAFCIVLSLATLGCLDEFIGIELPEGEVPETWAEARPAHYSYTYMRNCECLPEWGGPFAVRAMADSVVEVHRKVFPDSLVPVTENIQSYSIDSIMLDLSLRLAQEHDSAHVVYDSEYNFPVHAFIDFDFEAADEEYGFTITDFQVLSPPGDSAQ